MKRLTVLLVLLLTFALGGEPIVPFSPYHWWVTPDTFLQGAAIDLSRPYDLAAMRARFNINTINAYGVDAANVVVLQAAAGRLGMRVVIRLEDYDPDHFAFSAADASSLVNRYRSVLSKLRAGVVAYLLINMPVDDPRVHDRDRQAIYAAEAVAAVRSAAPGFPVFLGLFYGWDGSYDIPSYASADADGYVLTNYSYPGSHVATAATGIDELIDTPRLQKAMERAARSVRGKPVTVEYGFQTLAYQHGQPPQQTAGLVADRAAKEKAMQAVTEFYRSHYPDVIGTMYFGYDIVKPEGTPPRPLDFALETPHTP
jgi:hypothetical protein